MLKMITTITLSILANTALYAMDRDPSLPPVVERSSYPSKLEMSLPPVHFIKNVLAKALEVYGDKLPSGIPFVWNEIPGYILVNSQTIKDFINDENAVLFQVDTNESELIDIVYKDFTDFIKPVVYVKYNKPLLPPQKSQDLSSPDYDPGHASKTSPDVSQWVHYGHCKIGNGEKNFWRKKKPEDEPPVITCELINKGKQRLKDIALESVIKKLESGEMTIEDLQKLPNDLKARLPQSIQDQLPKS